MLGTAAEGLAVALVARHETGDGDGELVERVAAGQVGQGGSVAGGVWFHGVVVSRLASFAAMDSAEARDGARKYRRKPDALHAQ